MKRILSSAIISSIFFMSCTRTVYVVRHAEKLAPTDSLAKFMADDPALSEAGKVRAIVLKTELDHKHIKHIYSTNTIRTLNTAEPLSKGINVPVSIYGNIDSLVSLINSEKGSVLVVGHSNTVDDIVNKLTGEKKIATDLKDADYDNLFMVKIRGKKKFFRQR